MNRPIALVLVGLALAACGEEDCSLTNSCPGGGPTVTITAPTDGASFDEFQSVTFQGSATDVEDGTLAGGDLVWTSSIDGGIGTGTSFSRSDLSVGSHTITLTATDSDGNARNTSIDLTIADVANEKPVVTITSPADGGSAETGESVLFTGVATDAEDGNVTGAALVWTSDLDGTIGTGGSFDRDDLSGGTHEIVLTATDGMGAFGADTISFTITGAPTLSITAPTNQASGAPHTVTVGTSITFTGVANDAEDGPLTGTSLVWTSNVDGQIGMGASLTVGLTPGLHTVTLTATDSDLNEAKRTVLAIVKPANAAGYQIHIRWSEGVELSAAQAMAVDSAVDKLQAIIVGDVANLPQSEFPGDVPTCGGAAIPKMDEAVDDVIIYLEFVPIDGPAGTIGSAGPCFTRSGTAFTLVGGMRFDTADLATLETLGLMDDIVLHEMMHVLGFGIFWEGDPCVVSGLPFDYLEEPSDPSSCAYNSASTDTHFTGPNAIAWFDSIGGGSYTGGAIVPVENDDTEFGPGSLDGHWREGVFANEIMTPAADAMNPLSVLTVAQFEDLGYTVDYDAADPYTQVFSIVMPGAAATAFDLSDDVWRGPLYEIDAGGAARRVR